MWSDYARLHLARPGSICHQHSDHNAIAVVRARVCVHVCVCTLLTSVVRVCVCVCVCVCARTTDQCGGRLLLLLWVGILVPHHVCLTELIVGCGRLRVSSGGGGWGWVGRGPITLQQVELRVQKFIGI